MTKDFAPYPIPVHQGAGVKLKLEKIVTNQAVEALAKALKIAPLSIVAIGPATNLGILLLLYPELQSQMKEVILVAGRRTPESYFEIGKPVSHHAPDLNFDLDNDAFRILFERKLNIVLCPFEISNKVWITARDLEKLKSADLSATWLAENSRPWLQQWVELGEIGFNPFDVLASHYLIAPEDLISEQLNAHMEIHPNDMFMDSTEKKI